MPGARTYQTIGYATYQGGRLLSRRRKAVRRARRHKTKIRGALIAVVVAGLALVVARRGSGPTV